VVTRSSIFFLFFLALAFQDTITHSYPINLPTPVRKTHTIKESPPPIFSLSLFWRSSFFLVSNIHKFPLQRSSQHLDPQRLTVSHSCAFAKGDLNAPPFIPVFPISAYACLLILPKRLIFPTFLLSPKCSPSAPIPPVFFLFFCRQPPKTSNFAPSSEKDFSYAKKWLTAVPLRLLSSTSSFSPLSLPGIFFFPGPHYLFFASLPDLLPHSRASSTLVFRFDTPSAISSTQGLPSELFASLFPPSKRLCFCPCSTFFLALKPS